jgi:NAD(P)-dependent dehydrogenase (short-subunit alcohol dehydrogenase family)
VELLRLLIKKKKLKSPSSVVAISSIGGNEAFSFGQAIYGSSKAALLSWMKFSAKELASKQIRVNCVCPGHINTPMNDNLPYSPEELDEYLKKIPLQRFGEPHDIAAAVIYLLSDASSWITGSSLKIDGGVTL